MLRKIVNLTLEKPKTVILVYLIISVAFFTQFFKIKVDTDPENMLFYDDPARVTHREFKAEFALHDAIMVGVVDETHEKGVFTPEALKNIALISEEIMEIEGVIAKDLISPITTDDIQGGGGTLVIEPLMAKGELTQKQAELMRDAALGNTVLRDMLVSADGKAIAIGVPIKEKHESYRIATEIEEIIEKHKGSEEYHITGLPVAEDTFGVEMFKQMAISAPLAGLIIFLLMYYFFRSFIMIISPMIVAIISIIWTMGLLIGSGHTVHIMSSMIPIFLMPIAVVDSIHILSEFYDDYQKTKDRKATFGKVMDNLMTPMLFTSVTSSIGFLSLALTPIPPVRIFGFHVAFGIMSAWFLTITFIPAFVMILPEWVMKNFGSKKEEHGGRMLRVQEATGHFSTKRNKGVITVTLAIFLLSLWGITLTIVNDNPVYWFKKDHKIRVADRVLNSHFGGSYMSYLVLESNEQDIMKSPENLAYIEKLQKHMDKLEVVGKTTSIVDVIKKIGFELRDKQKGSDAIPATAQAVAQYLFLYEMSGDPEDLYHLIDPNYKKAAIWVHLKKGDNLYMKKVEEEVANYIEQNPLPDEIDTKWAGLTYINVVWQERMVNGMLKALMGSFVMVLFIMTFLFRSLIWGLISMVPLTVTIAFIYGLVGFSGKDYDMPIAVLSSLTLGLSVDFAIHLVQRGRQIFKEEGNWDKAIDKLFDEPVRAIIRNAIVIAIGFTPLLLAPLVPYQTVGMFMALIMAISGGVTLLVIPSIMTLIKSRLKV
ncbi:MAG: efflux RND transporter permease subunit [Deltaproteobacteria bacterium]|nr:efflux RND transporter permease subunit [Deltaproteobacteria bacterium]